MTLPQAVIVYFVCWWLLLFMALPIGVTPQRSPLPGVDTGAPAKPRLVVKCASVTVLAAVVTYAIYWIVRSGIMAVK